MSFTKQIKQAKAPKLSVITITYNQEEFVEQAFKSFLEQKTKFRYEVIVCDDASTDKTPSIIRRYAKKYPDIFRVTLREKNLGPTANFYDALSQAQSDYIALCEGDDYWADPRKLQKQVEFLEKNKDYGLCFHPVRVFFEDKSQPDTIFPSPELDRTGFDIDSLIKSNYIQTNSVVYRRQKYERIDMNVAPVDWYMHLYHAQFGKIGFIDEVMSAYRRHPGGMWWKASRSEATMWRKNSQHHLALYREMFRMYPDKKNLILPQIYHVFNKSITIGGSTLEIILAGFPDFGAQYLAHLVKAHREKDRYIKKINLITEKTARENQRLINEVVRKEEIISRLEKVEQEFSRIKQTKLWRTARLLKRLLSKNHG